MVEKSHRNKPSLGELATLGHAVEQASDILEQLDEQLQRVRTGLEAARLSRGEKAGEVLAIEAELEAAEKERASKRALLDAYTSVYNDMFREHHGKETLENPPATH